MQELLGRVVAIAANQHGLVTRKQLIGLGVQRHHLHRWKRAGLVRHESERVFSVAGAPATPHQRALAAVWSHGPDALLARLAAVDLWFPGRQRSTSPSVLVPFHHARVTGPWATHETRRLAAADRWNLHRIPVTSIERTLIDTGHHWGPRAVGSLLDDAVMRQFTTYERFAQRVDELSARGRPGITTARAVLLDRDLAGGSPFEQRMARLLRREGLPKPVREFHVEVGEHHYFVDFAYPEAKLGIECDSSTFHTLPDQFDHDLRRQNHIQSTGMLLLRYTTMRLRSEPRQVAAEIHRTFTQRISASGDAA